MAKTVVLDADGTSMDTNHLHTEAWARAFEEVGHRVTRVEVHKDCAALLEAGFPG